MLGTATLQAERPKISGMIEVLNGLSVLRAQINNLFPDNDGVELNFGPKEGRLTLVLHAKVNSDPWRKVFLLETQPIAGVHFTAIGVKYNAKSPHRKFIEAQILAEMP